MSRDKQIDEMACDMGRLFGCNESRDCSEIFARNLYNAGYRKASDLIEKVMEWLEEKGFLNIEVWAIQDVKDELKKKYESEETE